MGNDEPSYGGQDQFEDEYAYVEEMRRRRDRHIAELTRSLVACPDFAAQITTIAEMLDEAIVKIVTAINAASMDAATFNVAAQRAAQGYPPPTGPLNICERLAGRLYILGHDPMDLAPFATEEGLLALAAIVSTFPDEAREDAYRTNIDNIVGWGRVDKTEEELDRAHRWKVIAQRLDAGVSARRALGRLVDRDNGA
jgi:hypothetical protein